MAEAELSVVERLERAHQTVVRLCRPKNHPEHIDWVMHIPARPDEDPDLVIGEALLAARQRIRELEAELAEAKKDSNRLKKSVALLYDSWENGTPSYEDPEEYGGFLGNAFQLSDGDEAEILELLKDEPVHSVASQEAKHA